ncbi:hypothetical protein BCR34DRAFT_557966 [Clohesyomyces aquaticus]|uniref:Uncharacterized protein n=1 Tax=Clohesyomyces aquaticus TaxID=1231657 RepID=A0A1Y2A0M1_9PLEO|nr:hypothetical protein BCR34DRAFT_557966 [Clohesyomyces aquaticus]
MNSSQIPPAVGPCPLLSLPRELRDKIYEYVLHEEDGLEVNWVIGKFGRVYVPLGPDQTRPTGSKKPLLNPPRLSLVCRRIYEETKGLAPKVNDLVFRSSHGEVTNSSSPLATGSELFIDFVLAGNWRRPIELRHIRRVIIYDLTQRVSHLERRLIEIAGRNAPSALYRFCEDHPRAQVQIHLSFFLFNRWYPPASINWMKYGGAIEYACGRGESWPVGISEACRTICVSFLGYGSLMSRCFEGISSKCSRTWILIMASKCGLRS